MGTRSLTAVIENEQPKIAQYSQWDGYLGGQGSTVLEFLRTANLKEFKEKLKDVHFLSEEELKEINTKHGENWRDFYPQLSRDVGAGILKEVMDGVTELQNSYDFAKDSLFCEWAYVVDFDKKTFEIYEGFNQTPLTPEERFFGDGESKKEYYPVKLRKSYPLDNLPIESQMIKDCQDQEDEEELESDDSLFKEEKVAITIEIGITEKTVNYLINEFYEGPGMVITKEQVTNVLNKNKILACKIFEHGITIPILNDFTISFLEIILGMEDAKWPLLTDSKKLKDKFYTKLFAACKENFIKLRWSLEEFIEK